MVTVIEIKAEDFDSAVYDSPMTCPLAKALFRIYENTVFRPRVTIGLVFLEINEAGGEIYQLVPDYTEELFSQDLSIALKSASGVVIRTLHLIKSKVY